MSNYKNIYDACAKVSEGKKLSTIVDLGARHGEGYEAFGVNHKESIYHFVEPSKRCIPHIQKIIDKYPDQKFSLIEGVLGNSNSEIEFYQLEEDNDQSGNLFSNRFGHYGNAEIYKVKSYDFKPIFKKIEFLKCNIEGGEYQLIEDGFFDIVDLFVLEIHNNHVKGKNYKNVLQSLFQDFELEIWGDIDQKYCFINGKKRT
jgi:FkbM family methyltransferase